MISKVSECNFRFDDHFDKMELLKLFLKLLVLVPSYTYNKCFKAGVKNLQNKFKHNAL